jgi:hypothetical protein
LYLSAKQLELHPGEFGAYSIIRFTAPTTNLYNIASSFTAATNDGTTTDVHVRQNGNPVAGGDGNVSGKYNEPKTVLNSFTYTNTGIFLNAGQTIDFAVGYGSNGNYLQDSTGLDATLTVAPEPSQVAPFVFLAFGLGAMVVMKKKKASAAA